jgi:SulP family sulfate permease
LSGALSAADIIVTVVADLTAAVAAGMVLAALLYLYRISETTPVGTGTDEYIEDGRRQYPAA